MRGLQHLQDSLPSAERDLKAHEELLHLYGQWGSRDMTVCSSGKFSSIVLKKTFFLLRTEYKMVSQNTGKVYQHLYKYCL